MANEHKYRVLPNRTMSRAFKVSFVDLVEEHGFFSAVYRVGGCLTMIILFFGIFAVLETYYRHILRSDAGALIFPSAIIFSVGVVLLIHFLLGKVRIPSAERRRGAAAHEEAVKRVGEEAKALTTRLMQTYESSVGLRVRLADLLDSASQRLRRAEVEHRENAAHPFWDEVEEAASDIYYYQRALDELSRNAALYYEQLSGRGHNFPPFPVKPGAVPNASPVLSEFKRVIRLGLISSHFTKTLGQRGPVRGRIRDYASLRALMTELPASVYGSLYRLEKSVSSDAARAVEEVAVERRTPDAGGNKADEHDSSV